MSTTEVLQEAGKVQDQSLSALQRMKQNIAASKEVGASTAAQLEAQTRQLKNIDADVMKVKSNLSRADLLLRAFMRKIMTDKIIMLFSALRRPARLIAACVIAAVADTPDGPAHTAPRTPSVADVA